MRVFAVAAMAALVACGGGGGASGGTQGSAQPMVSSGDAALAFLRAAADSNVARMAQLWGTANGPASRTKFPPDWDRRIVVMQTYLRNDSSRVTSQAAVAGDETRRTVTVAIWRAGCVRDVPFTMVRSQDGGWLVNEFNIALLGNPARPCEPIDPPES